MKRSPKVDSPPADTARLELVPLGQLRGWPRNPKRHDLATIQRSFERFGFVLPLVEDASSGRLIAGHGRLEALLQMRDTGAQPPKRIGVDAGGDWLVPVLRGITFGDEREAEAYILADNKIAENGGWDDRLLAEVLGDLDVDAALVTGFSEDELSRLLEPTDTTVAAPPASPWAVGNLPVDDNFVRFGFGYYTGKVRRSLYDAFERARLAPAAHAALLQLGVHFGAGH